MTNNQISGSLLTQSPSCAVVRTPAGCVRRSATWTCCRPPNTQLRSCTSSGTGRGPAETPAVVPGDTKSGLHHTHHVALWVKMHSTLVVSSFSVVSFKPGWKVSEFYQYCHMIETRCIYFFKYVIFCWKNIFKMFHCRFLEGKSGIFQPGA